MGQEPLSPMPRIRQETNIMRRHYPTWINTARFKVQILILTGKNELFRLYFMAGRSKDRNRKWARKKLGDSADSFFLFFFLYFISFSLLYSPLPPPPSSPLFFPSFSLSTFNIFLRRHGIKKWYFSQRKRMEGKQEKS